MAHTVVRRIFHKFKKVMKSSIEAIDHTLQRDSGNCGVYVCYYAEEIAKGEWTQLYIDFRSVRYFKITYGVNVIDAPLTFPWPTLTLIWVGFLGVRFEVEGGVKLSPLPV